MISVIKKFNILLNARQKSRLIILFLITLGGAFWEVLGVTLMLPLVSAVMTPEIIETNELVKKVCGIFGIQSHRSFVILCIVALIVVFIVKNLFLILEYYIQARFVFNNRVATQKRILHAYMLQSYEYYLCAKSGEIYRIIQADVVAVYQLLMTLMGMTTELVIAVALIVTIFVVDPYMTVIVAIMMGGVLAILALLFRPRLRREGDNLRKHSSLLTQWVMQAISGIKEVKVMQKESFFEKKYEEHSKEVVRSEKINSVLSGIPRMFIEMISVCSMLFVIAVMIYRGRELDTLIPALSAFAMAAVKLMPSANRIMSALNAVAYSAPSLDLLLNDLKILDELPNNEDRIEIQDKSSDRLLSVTKSICIKDMSYKYPTGEYYVLNDAYMEIPIGKSVGIVGKSGAGKTTAVDILLGLLKPQTGQVLADGIDVMKNYVSWLKHIGYIPQVIFMLDGTVRDNVAFGVDLKEIDDKKVWYALEEAQLADFIRSLPEGLETQIGERGIRLSGGQRQRIGIARALYEDPELLIFDEATSALDNETEAAIMESINSLHGKKTMIIIAHRLQTIEGCDMVYRVEDGKILRER